MRAHLGSYAPFLAVALTLMAGPSWAQESAQSAADSAVQATPAVQCASASDLPCMLDVLSDAAGAIPETNWRDQTLRELAKLMSKQKRYDDAIAVIARIESPDTKAMTIRGIGMEAAGLHDTPEHYDALFAKLAAEAEKIDHAPSHAIAQTYIAMAQAFAGDNDGATKTAMAMDNQALRNKALGESAEIQAERGDLDQAVASIKHIDDPGYADKAYRSISEILSRAANYDKAFAAANRIDNKYQRAQAILFLLARQISPDEISVK